jgi:hypothetical protein
MREPLLPYKGHDRINFLCLIASEMMGEMTLARMPALLAGFDSIKKTLSGDVVRALNNVRLSGFSPSTLRELTLMIEAYRVHHESMAERRARGETQEDDVLQRFIISDEFTIQRRWTHIVPEDVQLARQSLNAPLPLRARAKMAIHDARRSAEIGEHEGFNAYISPFGFVPPEPPLYDIERVAKAPGLIPWSGLIAIADQFDTADVVAGRQASGDRSWHRRLHDVHGEQTAVLLEATEKGLVKADGIMLDGLKHLIGLPGAGKTTLLFLLAAYLSQYELTACFLFPSIEVATAFIETLGRYEIEVGLLSGQGETAKTKHVLNFATALAGQNRGFGVSRPVDRFFSTNCALAGFASDEDLDFPHHSPPCLKILQRESEKKRTRPHQCALSSVCGYQYGERMLAGTGIWAGHMLSMDRSVSRLFSDANVRHFEFIARTFDLLVVDECDGSQNNLDARGTPIMNLVGDSDSLWNTLIRDIHQPAAGGRNAFVAGESLPTLLEMTGRFGRATERLIGRIVHFPPRFKIDNANVLQTAMSLIADMFADETERDMQRRYDAGGALERIWDATIKKVAFRVETSGDDDEPDLDNILADAAVMLCAKPEDVRAFYDRLLLSVERWERDGNDAAVKEIAIALKSIPNLTSPMDDETFFASCGLLVSVSLVVLQHFGLSPYLRLMNAQGLVSDNVFSTGVSRDQMAILPDSLIGRMSGVRYTISEEGNVNVSHVSFAGTPRVLPARMIGVGEEMRGHGMAVLLTSATSMLEHSPSFHVKAGPHYVLQRPNAGDGWKNSRYAFFPKNDPANNNIPLRFSGAKMAQRERVLCTMVDQLFRGLQVSDVANAISSNDVVDGVSRKAGFVVNSYEQCALLYEHIHANHPSWRGQVRFLTRASLHGSMDPNAVTAAEVEQLGQNRGWDLLIFPMSAIGRGVNIVFQYGPRINKAMIGSLFFLTRPHPRGDSLQLIQGLVGRASEDFDQQRFSNTDVALAELKAARKATVRMAEQLLRVPLVTQALGEYAEAFVADQMIIILQTIGRAMRGDCPAFVYFVDAAWAPNSAKGEVDTERSSMLVTMQAILEKCLNHPEPAKRECYQNLYQSFAQPMNSIANLFTKKS